MEKKGNIELRDEIYLEDAYKIAEWLDNEKITEYLTEGSEISREIRNTVKYNTCPVITHLFCSGGNFYMILNNGRPIGDLKLIRKGSGCEVVIVIGDTAMWNRGYGTEALKLALSEAFFRLRYDSVTAKIMFGNDSSSHIFEKAGFAPFESGKTCSVLKLRMEEFLKAAA